MTHRLHAALAGFKPQHERGPFVLMHEDGRRWTGDAVEWRVCQSQWRAGLGTAPTLRKERGKYHAVIGLRRRRTCP